MLNQQAEESYRNGMQLLADGRPRDALAFFRGAIELEDGQSGGGRGDARYLSFCGLSLCLSREDIHKAIGCCRGAAKLDPTRPDVWWNLGRVAMVARRRGEAYRALRYGLRLDPNHQGMRTDLKRLGIRRRPPISFLPRSHKANVFLGRLRLALKEPVGVGLRRLSGQGA